MPTLNKLNNANNNQQPFSFDVLQNQGGTNGIYDISMEMGDLAAMLQQNSQTFSLDDILNGNQLQQPQAQALGSQQLQQTDPQQITQPISSNIEPVNTAIDDSDETARLLAQLEAMADSGSNQQPAVDATTNVDEDDINALLASLGDVNDQDFGNFDFSTGMDMGNLGDMTGLFNTSTIAEQEEKPPMPIPEVAPTNPDFKIEPQVVDQPSRNQAQNEQAPTDLTADMAYQNSQPTSQSQQQPRSLPSLTTEAAPIAPAPKVEEPAINQSIENTDFSGIDMDDFNFGDGDENAEGMDMDGDEFDRLLAGAFDD